MAENGKQSGGFFLDLSSLLCPVGRKRKAKLFLYGFLSTFVACTIYVAFCPYPTSPLFGSLFSPIDSYKSQASSILSRFFPISETTSKDGALGGNESFPSTGYPPSSQNTTDGDVTWKNQTSEAVGYPPTPSSENTTNSDVLELNQTSGAAVYPPTKVNTTKAGVLEDIQTSEGKNLTSEAAAYPSAAMNTTKGGVFERNQTTEGKNQTDGHVDSHNDGLLAKNLTSMGDGVHAKNQTGVGVGWTGNGTTGGNGSRKGHYWSLEGLKGCDLFRGRWVRDESYPLYKQGSCPHIDESFNCFLNRRPDREYEKLRWQPDGCNIPRLNATDMLERLRGKRLVFVGDSLNRNMWESLVCILRNSVKDKKKVFEASGRHEFKTDVAYSFKFKDYGCSVEFFRAPFLVQEWEMPDGNGKKRETLRLDIMDKWSSKFKDANVIVFNTGHWWTHEKTSKGKDYYQEGDHVYSDLNVMEAYRKALKTWGRWLDAKVDPKKTMVFFRGFSATHFRGGQWNSGGQCDHETEPITDDKFIHRYPAKMQILESVMQEMKTHVSYLNITRMSDYRKEGHPSIYRNIKMTEEERNAQDHVQDCSHWCLPGVPDSWNELLYAQLLVRQHKQQ